MNWHDNGLLTRLLNAVSLEGELEASLAVINICGKEQLELPSDIPFVGGRELVSCYTIARGLVPSVAAGQPACCLGVLIYTELF